VTRKETQSAKAVADTEKALTAPDWIVSNIAEASKGAQQVFFIFVSLLSYSAITMLATADRQIILNSTVQLPLLNIPVSLEGFFILAPSVSLLVYAYLQLYLQRLKGLVHELRAYGPIPPRRLYPWALTISEDAEPGSVGVLQNAITSLCLWWLLPFVFLLFAFSSLKKHSPALSYAVSIYPLLGLAAAVYFWGKFARNSRKAILSPSIWSLTGIVLVVSALLIGYVIPSVRKGGVNQQNDRSKSAGYWMAALQKWSCVDLSYQVLVTEQKKEYDTLWVDLENAHLECANLDHTILKLANLKGAYLQRANLRGTTLRGALLENADFADANFSGVDMSYSRFRSAKNISKAELCKAKTLYKAEMDGNLEAGIRSTCPEILTEKSQD
jgi:hypothetical protein